VGDDRLFGGPGIDRIIAAWATTPSPRRAAGRARRGDGADTISGDAAEDKITGGAGNDTLNGGADADGRRRRRGRRPHRRWPGPDLLLGGAGNDFISEVQSDELERIDGGRRRLHPHGRRPRA